MDEIDTTNCWLFDYSGIGEIRPSGLSPQKTELPISKCRHGLVRHKDSDYFMNNIYILVVVNMTTRPGAWTVILVTKSRCLLIGRLITFMRAYIKSNSESWFKDLGEWKYIKCRSPGRYGRIDKWTNAKMSNILNRERLFKVNLLRLTQQFDF